MLDKSLDLNGEMGDILKEYFGIYVKYVVKDRAIPDIRDGLKPVHRRLIYAAWDMGARAPGKMMKSAKPVSECMGNYHPHGDQSIYDSLVRMTQDFSMRIPLFDAQGNFGSIDGDPAAAMRYCIVGDQRIKTDNGLIKIEDLCESTPNSTYNINIKILSQEKKVNKANKFFNSGYHDTYLLKTSEGFEIEGSFNHPVLILDKEKNGKPIFTWKMLGSISAKDKVVIDRSQKSIFSDKASKKQINLAIIAGCLISKGRINSKKIGFNNTNLQYFENFIKAWESLFGKNYYRNSRKLKSGKKNYEFNFHLAHSKDAKRIKSSLLYQHLINKKSSEQTIPDFIFRMPKDAQRIFLQYLFEGNGSISLLKNNTINIQYSTQSKIFAKDILILLLEFGVIGRISKNLRKEYRVSISAFHNIKEFQNNIGFSNLKNIKLKSLVDSEAKRRNIIKKRKGGLSNDYIPFISSYIRHKNKDEFIVKNNIDRYERIDENSEQILSKLDKESKEIYNNLIKNRYYFATVKSCKKQNKQKLVYSIKVNSNCHSFVANGFINHNTETRLNKTAQEMFCNDLNKDVVDFIPNYDESTFEPLVLPSELPHLILNCNSGIAVGVATDVVSCCPQEIIDCILKEIDKEEVSKGDSVLSCFKGLDLPTGGIIENNKKELYNLWENGNSNWKVRGEAKFETDESSGIKRIIITSLPYQQQKNKLLEEIAKYATEKREDGKRVIDGISDIRDESNKEVGIRIVIDISLKADANVVLNLIYKKTKLQKSINTNMVALVDGKPKHIGIKHVLLCWLNFRRECIKKILTKEKREKENRLEIVCGLLIVHDNIDKAIKIIRNAKNTKQELMEKMKLSSNQVNSVIEMRLGSLRKIDEGKLKEEKNNLKNRIIEIEKTLKSPKDIDKIIKERLIWWKKNLDERRTKVVKKFDEITTLDTIVEQNVVVLISNKDEVKLTDTFSYRKTNRGASGVKEGKSNDDSAPRLVAQVTTHDMLYAFTNKSRVFEKPCYELPITKRRGKSFPLCDLFPDLEKDEKVVDILAMNINDMSNDSSIIIVRSNGTVKRMACKGLLKKRGRLNGDLCCRADLDDSELIKVTLAEPDEDLILFTKDGYFRRVSVNTFRILPTRKSGANKCFNLSKDDKVISVDSIQKKDFVVSVSEKGYGAKFKEEVLPIKKGRSGKGIRLSKTDSKSGRIIYGGVLKQEDELFLTTSGGKSLRTSIKKVREIGRGCRGVKMQKLDNEEKIVAATRININ